jgi:long-chain acyl-CoA synthetase
MREATGPTWDPLPRDAHLLQPVIDRAARAPDRAIAAYRDGDRFVDVSAAEFWARARSVAKGLIATGVQPGDRVALMARTRLEWLVLDYGILAAGGVTVPIYDTSSAEQVQWIIGDSEAVIAVVETAAMRAVFDDVATAVPQCREALVIDDGALADLARRGDAVSDHELDGRIAGITTDRLATIIYTSGTTGRPKGCVLTHGNLRTNVLQNLDAVGAMLGDDEVSLLFLPLAHSLARVVALIGMEHGVKGAFATDIAHLVEELGMARPTMVVSVPRVFEKVWNTAQHKAHAEGKGAIFDHAASVAIEWSRAHEHHRIRPVIGAEHALFDALVYSKVRAVFGGRLRFAFSGGGPLGERLTHFFNGIGVRIFEGYGLTETSPTLTLNRALAWKAGTVGLPLAGTTIRIAGDGEILATGPQVFTAYWHNEVATDETFDDDGWFRTGDIGELDDDGFLRITGRKKELIVTAAGKNVAPAPLEDRIRAHPLVSQAVVVGDARPFVAALLSLDPEAFAEWASEHGREGASVAELEDDPELQEALQKAIDDANAAVSRAESIRKFAVLPHDLSIAEGELTPTLKVRRSIVEKTYAHIIDDLYRA